MMNNKINKIVFIFFLVISIMLVTKIQVNAASNISLSNKVITTEGSLATNSNYQSFTSQITNEAGVTTNQNISYVKVNLASARVVTSCVLDKNGIVASDVLTIAKNYEQNHPGYEVLAAINGGYFFTYNPYETVNACVVDGNVVKANNHSKYFSLGFKSDKIDFVTSKVNSFSSNYYLTFYDANHLPFKEIQLSGENIAPASNQTTFYNGTMTTTVVNNVSYFEVEALHNFSYDNIFIDGTVKAPLKTINRNVAIATTDEEVKTILEQQPFIRIERKLTGVLKDYDNVIGPGSQPLKNGIIQTPEEMGDQSVAFCKGRDPRSSVGFDNEGNVYLCAIDGRQTNMAGISLTEEAYLMQELGCVNAFNLDGGGSTELVIKENGTFKVFNKACETPYRKVTDAILIVIPKVQVEISEPAITNTSIAFNYQKTNDSNSQINIYVNGQKITTTENVKIDNLDPSTSNFVNVVATYQEDGKEINILIKTFQINDTKEASKTTLVEPTNFQVEFVKISGGFEAILSCDDPTSTLSAVYLVDQNNNRQILLKDGDHYHTTYQASTNMTYTFQVVYRYKINSIKVEEKTYQQTFSYEYKEDASSSDTEKTSSSNCQNCQKSKGTLIFATIGTLTSLAFVFLKKAKQ